MGCGQLQVRTPSPGGPFCPPVAELVLRVNSPDCRFDPLAKKFSSVRFPVSPAKNLSSQANTVPTSAGWLCALAPSS